MICILNLFVWIINLFVWTLNLLVWIINLLVWILNSFIFKINKMFFENKVRNIQNDKILPKINLLVSIINSFIFKINNVVRIIKLFILKRNRCLSTCYQYWAIKIRAKWPLNNTIEQVGENLPIHSFITLTYLQPNCKFLPWNHLEMLLVEFRLPNTLIGLYQLQIATANLQNERCIYHHKAFFLPIQLPHFIKF